MKYIALVCALLVGCAPPKYGLVGSAPLPPKTFVAATVQAQTTVQRDEFKRVTNYMGPEVATSDSGKHIALFASKGAAQSSYLIRVEHTHGQDWFFYQSAFDSDGNQLPHFVLDRQVGCRGGCTFTETSGVGVTREYLEQHRSSGVRVKISGKYDEMLVELPPAYVQGFLLATL